MNRTLPLFKTACLVVLAWLAGLAPAQAQKFLEKLNRGVVAVRTSSSQVYVGWRLFGTDPAGIAFNVYRGAVKVNATPITGSTNFVDNTTATTATYSVRPVLNGAEQAGSATAPTLAQQFLKIPLQIPAGGTTPAGEAYTYTANDCSTADLDGDGEYEFVVKWDPTNAKDNSQSGYTGNVYLDAYKLNGTRLWRIDLGRNIRAGAHYTQLMVYDLDSDGKAEVACKTADATVDGAGTVIGSATADYRTVNGYILTGPEFLTVFNGQTGAAMATTNYLPARGTVTSWGDNYGNRVDRFVSAIAYLDGQRPSLVMGRGYYTRLVRAAWDWRNGQLTSRWVFDSNTPGNGAYAGQGNHQLTVGDVDGDGKDEVCNGASAIDDNGTGLYANGLGHGDALHMGDLDPNRPGQEVWQCHEDPGSYGVYGLEFRDARTGQPLWGVATTGDIGRAQAGDIDPAYVGAEVWGSSGGLYTCTGTLISAAKPATVNFGLWWDGDLQRELLDGDHIDKWNPATSKIDRQLTIYAAPYNMGYNNSTKRNPGLSADVLGDWREEVISRTYDNQFLVVLTTIIPTTYRLPTLMHDAQYRTQVALQNSAYNQPPHPSYYLGGGMSAPPVANITLINANSAPLGSAATYLSPANGAPGVALASATLTWQGAASRYNVFVGTSPQALQLVAEGTTQTSYSLAAPVAAATYYWRVDALYDGDAIRDGETAVGAVWSFAVAPTTVWTGAVSTDWFTAGNWTMGVPTATFDALVPVVSTNYPLVAAGTATVHSLTLATGASLRQSGGTLSLAGDLFANGTLAATGGTLATTGSTAQTLVGSSLLALQNLTIGTAGAALSTATSFRGVLTLAGDLTTNGQALTLLSGMSGGVPTDGLVVNSGGVVVGTATVQRAIDPSLNSGLGYRHYSAPVSTSTVADLATSGFAPVVNPAYNAAAAPANVAPYPTVFGYDDRRLNLSNNLGSFDKGYFSPAALSDPLTVGRGYTVNIAAAEVVDFQGTLNNGDLTLPFTSTRATYPDGGWQLLGNPYPAPLNYASVDPTDRVGLEDAIYVYSSTSQYAGRYRSYVNGIGNPVLPVGQGFFARVAAGLSSATLTFRNSQRLAVPSATTFQRPAADARPLVQLTLQGASAALTDEVSVYFEAGATSGFEPAFDAEKLANTTGLNLATSQGSHQLSIDGQPELGASERVVPLAVGAPAAGIYTFTASQLLNLAAVPVYLRDLQLGTLTDLRQQPSYQFTVANAAALNTTRFALVFSPQRVLASVPAALAQQVAVYPNPAKTQVAIELPLSLSRQPVTATLLDALGRVVRTQVLPAGLATHTVPLTNVAPGVYSLRLTTEQGPVVKKLTVD